MISLDAFLINLIRAAYSRWPAGGYYNRFGGTFDDWQNAHPQWREQQRAWDAFFRAVQP